MKVERSKLARRLGLPANSHESTIRARLAGVELEREVRATRASLASVSRPQQDPATIRASSDAELRGQLSASSLTSPKFPLVR